MFLTGWWKILLGIQSRKKKWRNGTQAGLFGMTLQVDFWLANLTCFLTIFRVAVMALVYKIFLGTPLKLWASIGHWAVWHFDLNKYSDQQKPRVIVSLVAVALFILVGWPLIIHYSGWTGFFKFWLMPWLGYHFWMSKLNI